MPSTCRFTVFTPTFNRARTLPRVYESLRQQSFRDFEWLIVDDGSTDDTREVVATFDESLFPIRYVHQANGHKKTASNRGVREARGEFFLTLDSDDEILPHTLERLNFHWESIPAQRREEFSAVTGLCVDDAGQVVGRRFPADVFDSDSMEIRYRYKITGEKFGFQRTDVMRTHPFPEDVAGHVPEGIVWSAIASRYKTRYVNESFRIYHASEDALSRPSSIQNQAEGLALWAREVLAHDVRYFRHDPVWFLRMAANYTRFHRHMALGRGRKWPLVGWRARVLTFLMWPAGFALFLKDARRR